MNYKSTTNNQTLMTQARESLTGKWAIPIGAWIVLLLLTNLGNDLFFWKWEREGGGNYQLTLNIITWIISGPLTLGYTAIILLIARNQKLDFALLFSGFKRFGVALATYLLMIIFVILWMLLLIIPGIIACLRYSQTWYILLEDKNISPLDAIRKSKEMMVNNKWKLFCLYCRFIGWLILCIITLGLATLYVMPYMGVSCAKFYDDLKNGVSIENLETAPESSEPISANPPESLESEKEDKDEGEKS